MSKLHDIAGSGTLEREAIAADRVVEGAPIAETRVDYERDERIYVGEWAADVGAWRVSYDEWEFCHMLEGACELAPDDGAARPYKSGDSFVIEPGFSGVWRVTQAMRKRFVILLKP